MTSSSVLVFIVVIACCYAVPRRYDGYKLLRTIPDTDDDVNSLRVLRDITEGDEVDFWNGIKGAGTPVDMAVSPEMHQTLVALLEDFGLRADIAIEDVQILIDEQIRPSLKSRIVKRDVDSTPSEGFDYTVYHRLNEITDWIDDIANTYNDIVSKVDVGMSYEGRVISALKIGRDSPTGTSKPVAWLQAGIHAREWISSATVIFITNELVSNYGIDDEITNILDELDIYIIPVLNVDGYAFTWNGDRLWRKTRSPYDGCIGADPNRNYDWHWGELGADPDNPCNGTYTGPEPVSEIEISSVTQFMLNLNESGVDIRTFFDFHAYSQVWMSPWGYTENLPDDYNDQNDLTAKAVDAVIAVHGTDYIYGPIANTMYVASGCSVDWAYGTLGITYSFTIELRDTGNFGFTLPPRFIEPTAIETLEGLKVVLNHIL